MATVTVRSLVGYRQEIITSSHTLIADEPREVGGTDAGPDPYELLLGALGACKSMTVLMYARRKGWDLRSVEVTLTHSRVHQRDCEDCPDRVVQIERITSSLRLEGGLDDEQRQRLKQIAGRCPVHRTLTQHVEIVDE